MPRKNTIVKSLQNHAEWAFSNTMDGAPISLLPTLLGAEKLIVGQAKKIKRLKRIAKDREKFKSMCEAAEKDILEMKRMTKFKKAEEIKRFLDDFIILCLRTMMDEISKLREHAEWAKSNGWGLPIMMEDDMEDAEKAIRDLAETCKRLKSKAMLECCCCETIDHSQFDQKMRR